MTPCLLITLRYFGGSYYVRFRFVSGLNPTSWTLNLCITRRAEVAVTTSGQDIIPHTICNFVNASSRSHTIVVQSDSFWKHTDTLMTKCSVYYNVKAGGIHVESFYLPAERGSLIM